VPNELTHIVALTSYTNEKIKQECFAAGIKKVINKPLKYKTLHAVMWKHYFRVDPDDYLPIFKGAFNHTYQESEEEEEKK
jgi:response regulator RpfG family c-di-GMP phosphodiesterase